MRVGYTTNAFARRDRAAVELEALKGVNAMEAQYEATIESPIMGCLVAGANVAAITTPKSLIRTARAKSPRLTFRFDRTNPQAVSWAKQHAGELVTDVTDQTRRAIRKIITRAFTENIPPRQAAILLRKVVGLNERQEEALDKIRRTMQGDEVPLSKMNARLAKHADRMVRERSLMIARTETIRASNEGQTQLWQQAVDAGKLPRSVQRVWITTEGACPEICEPLEGKRAPLTGAFENKYDSPPAHPGCRCTTGITG